MDKTLSIILASYNMETYLSRCLESLLSVDAAAAQRLDIIIVNDGSTDKTSELAHEWAKKHPALIRVVDKPNGHYGSAINAGLAIACGEYVRIVDPDDWVAKEPFANYLRKLDEFVQQPEDVRPDLVLTDSEKVHEDKVPFDSLVQPFDEGWVDERQFFLKCSRERYYPGLTGLTYRLKILRDMEYRQTEGVPYSDDEWVAYPMSRVHRIYCLHQCVYEYFFGRSDQSMSAANLAKKAKRINTKLATRMVEESERYLSSGTPAYREFYLFRLLASVSPIYYNGLLHGGEVLFEGGARGFDAFLRVRCPEAARALETWTVKGIRYVKLLHEGANVRLGALAWACRLYARVLRG